MLFVESGVFEFGGICPSFTKLRFGGSEAPYICGRAFVVRTRIRSSQLGQWAANSRQIHAKFSAKFKANSGRIQGEFKANSGQIQGQYDFGCLHVAFYRANSGRIQGKFKPNSGQIQAKFRANSANSSQIHGKLRVLLRVRVMGLWG